MTVVLLTAAGILAGCNGPTPPSKIAWPPVWITATWSGGRTGPPLQLQSQTPETWDGQLCPPAGLDLYNIDRPQSLSMGGNSDCAPFDPTCVNLLIRNRCPSTVTAVMCVASGSGAAPPRGASLTAICPTDPTQADPLALSSEPLFPGLYPVSVTTANLTVNIFYCGSGDVLTGPPLKCSPLP